MSPKRTTEVCAVCGNELPDDPPSVTVPGRPALRLTPLASPGVVEVPFCGERHKRDWIDSHRGRWPNGEEPPEDSPK